MRHTVYFSAVLLALAVTGMPSARAADPKAMEEAYRSLLTTKSTVVVNVKFVLKLKGAFGEQERESEVTGVMIDPKGVVLCSNMSVGGFANYLRGRTGDVSVTATDIRVLIGDDTEGVEGELVARDSELDLAWIRIKDPASEGYKFQDFASAATPRIGETLLCVRRMGKYFDRTAAIVDGRVAGRTRKPRELIVPSGDIAGALGLPVYTTTGQIVGVIVVQVPDPDDLDVDPRAVFQEMESGLILPGSNVLTATRRAMESAARQKAETQPAETATATENDRKDDD